MIHVVLVEPRYGGNIGSVARVLKNFGVEDLRIVKPREPIGEEAFSFAAKAGDVLSNAKIYDSLEDALRGADLIVGTTARGDDKYFRNPITPEQLREIAGGEVFLVFGREDHGLRNRELKMCDVVVKIPTRDEYPTMNVSHAAAIILYELSKRPLEERGDRELREGFLRHLQTVLEAIGYPKHRIGRTMVTVRRLLVRAKPTDKEITLLRGILRRIERNEGRD